MNIQEIIKWYKADSSRTMKQAHLLFGISPRELAQEIQKAAKKAVEEKERKEKEKKIAKAIAWYKADPTRTMKQVKERFGVTPYTLYKRGVKANIPQRSYTALEKEIVLARYVNGETLDCISGELGIPKETIRDWTHAAKVTRPSNPARKEPEFRNILATIMAFPGYGKTEICELGGFKFEELNSAFGDYLFREKVPGKQVPQPFSQTKRFTLEVRKAMGKMYEEGASYNEVSAAFNASMPTVLKCVASVGVKSRTMSEGQKLRLAKAKKAKLAAESLVLEPITVAGKPAPSILTDEMREEIVEAYVNGMSPAEVSAVFGVEIPSVIRFVIARRGREALREAG